MTQKHLPNKELESLFEPKPAGILVYIFCDWNGEIAFHIPGVMNTQQTREHLGGMFHHIGNLLIGEEEE